MCKPIFARNAINKIPDIFIVTYWQHWGLTH